MMFEPQRFYVFGLKDGIVDVTLKANTEERIKTLARGLPDEGKYLTNVEGLEEVIGQTQVPKPGGGRYTGPAATC